MRSSPLARTRNVTGSGSASSRRCARWRPRAPRPASRRGSPSGRAAVATAVNDSMGARSQLAALLAAVAVVAILLFLTAPIAHLPKAVLGAAIVSAAIGLIDIAAWRTLAAADRVEVVIAAVTAVGVVVVGVLEAVVFAVGLTILDAVRRSARPGDAVLGYDPVLGRFADVAQRPDARVVPGVVVYRLDDRLFFANARYVTRTDARGRPRRADHHTLARAGRRVHRPDRLDRTGGARATRGRVARRRRLARRRAHATRSSATASTRSPSISKSGRVGSIPPSRQPSAGASATARRRLGPRQPDRRTVSDILSAAPSN